MTLWIWECSDRFLNQPPSRFVFSSASPLRDNAPLMCFRMNVWPYCPSCCLLSQITFWHSSLLSESLRWLWPKASGGPNDKASLTISRQEHGGEWGKLNCQGEKRGEEECWRGGWRRGGAVTPSCKMEPVIICSFGAHQSLPSLAHTAPLTFLPLWHPFSSVGLPSVLLSLVTTFPLFFKTVLYIRDNAPSIPTCSYWHYSYYPHQVI